MAKLTWIAAWLLASCPLSLACDDNNKENTADTDADSDTDTDADSDTDTDADADANTDTDTDTDADTDAATCAQAAADLGAELYEDIGGSTVTVRLDYLTHDILGYQVFAGPYSAVDEAAARAKAQANTGFGQSGKALNPDYPEDEYVFYESPGDFGGCAAVSRKIGQTVFGGSIHWMGKGDITYPLKWRSASDLASGCPPVGSEPPQVAAYDLVQGTAADPEEIAPVIDVVMDTAIPAAIWSGGYLFDIVVLLYPRTVGEFDASTAEWIVMVNGGWLE